jgi:hypothetical protein
MVREAILSQARGKEPSTGVRFKLPAPPLLLSSLFNAGKACSNSRTKNKWITYT